MEFELNEKILEFLTLKTNDFKKQQYIDLFNTFIQVNKTGDLIYKFSPSDIELELLNLLEIQEDLDDALLEMDSLLKRVILENLRDNGIVIDPSIPQYLLVEFLEVFVYLYSIEQDLTEPLLNILDQLGNVSNQYILGQLLNEYAISNSYEMVEYISSIDTSILHNLKVKYEEDETTDHEESKDLNVDDINLFIIKYDVSKFKGNKFLNIISKNDLYNKKFEAIFPFLNEVLLDTNDSKEYLQYLFVAYIASKEGYNDLLRNYTILDEYSLLEDREDYSKEQMKKDLLYLLQSVKRS